MGKHVDTIRPVDMTLDGRAREPRHLVDPWGQDPRYTYQRDVWSGNPDTDKAWRGPIVTHEIAPLHQRQGFERR